MARRKPRLFAFPREVELAHLQLWARDPEQVRLLTAVVDAFAEIAARREISAELLAPFDEAARHPDAQLRGTAMTRLSVLCHYFEEAVELYGHLVHDADPGVRVLAVNLLANTPVSVQRRHLPTALQDEDGQVRKAAAGLQAFTPPV